MAELFTPAIYESVARLPYGSRLAMEKWQDSERSRVEHWNLESPNGSLLELVELLNSKSPDRQVAAEWFDAHNGSLTLEALMILVSESRVRGYADALRANSDKKRNTTTKKKIDVGYRWLQYQAGSVDGVRHSKNSAAPKLAKEFYLSERRIREEYLANIEENRQVFPKGVDAARAELGLLPEQREM